jgi:hypothetical protein
LVGSEEGSEMSEVSEDVIAGFSPSARVVLGILLLQQEGCEVLPLQPKRLKKNTSIYKNSE